MGWEDFKRKTAEAVASAKTALAPVGAALVNAAGEMGIFVADAAGAVEASAAELVARVTPAHLREFEQMLIDRHNATNATKTRAQKVVANSRLATCYTELLEAHCPQEIVSSLANKESFQDLSEMQLLCMIWGILKLHHINLVVAGSRLFEGYFFEPSNLLNFISSAAEFDQLAAMADKAGIKGRLLETLAIAASGRIGIIKFANFEWIWEKLEDDKNRTRLLNAVLKQPVKSSAVFFQSSEEVKQLIALVARMSDSEVRVKFTAALILSRRRYYISTTKGLDPLPNVYDLYNCYLRFREINNLIVTDIFFTDEKNFALPEHKILQYILSALDKKRVEVSPIAQAIIDKGFGGLLQKPRASSIGAESHVSIESHVHTQDHSIQAGFIDGSPASACNDNAIVVPRHKKKKRGEKAMPKEVVAAKIKDDDDAAAPQVSHASELDAAAIPQTVAVSEIAIVEQFLNTIFDTVEIEVAKEIANNAVVVIENTERGLPPLDVIRLNDISKQMARRVINAAMIELQSSLVVTPPSSSDSANDVGAVAIENNAGLVLSVAATSLSPIPASVSTSSSAIEQLNAITTKDELFKSIPKEKHALFGVYFDALKKEGLSDKDCSLILGKCIDRENHVSFSYVYAKIVTKDEEEGLDYKKDLIRAVFPLHADIILTDKAAQVALYHSMLPQGKFGTGEQMYSEDLNYLKLLVEQLGDHNFKYLTSSEEVFYFLENLNQFPLHFLDQCAQSRLGNSSLGKAAIFYFFNQCFSFMSFFNKGFVKLNALQQCQYYRDTLKISVSDTFYSFFLKVWDFTVFRMEWARLVKDDSSRQTPEDKYTSSQIDVRLYFNLMSIFFQCAGILVKDGNELITFFEHVPETVQDRNGHFVYPQKKFIELLNQSSLISLVAKEAFYNAHPSLKPAANHHGHCVNQNQQESANSIVVLDDDSASGPTPKQKEWLQKLPGTLKTAEINIRKELGMSALAENPPAFAEQWCKTPQEFARRYGPVIDEIGRRPKKFSASTEDSEEAQRTDAFSGFLGGVHFSNGKGALYLPTTLEDRYGNLWKKAPVKTADQNSDQAKLERARAVLDNYVRPRLFGLFHFDCGAAGAVMLRIATLHWFRDKNNLKLAEALVKLIDSHANDAIKTVDQLITKLDKGLTIPTDNGQSPQPLKIVKQGSLFKRAEFIKKMVQPPAAPAAR